MRWRRHSPDDIVGKLASIAKAVDSGTPLQTAIGEAGVSQATYFRWRAQYGTLSLAQLQLVKALEAENARLRRALAELDENFAASANAP